ncbi:MAG: hypothetical protein LUO80_03825 [Methylococcaceae bacterium]|nr:hypothetical protein [Methylococcaceae bacterium]
MNWLLVFIPIAFGLDWYRVDPLVIFAASAVAIIPLASLMEQATDALAHYLGPTYGGLLSATMGNAPELIIGISALRNGLIDILKGSIAGSVLGTLLFGLGITIISGGLKKPVQTFDRDMVSINSALLMLATFGLVIPAVFTFSSNVNQEISLEISIVLLLIYLASMAYTIMTSRSPVGRKGIEAALKEKGEEQPEVAEVFPNWSRNTALGILAAVAVALALVSDLLTGSLQPAADAMGLTPVFAGVFLLAMVGNIPQYMNSVSFAYKSRMTLALSINLADGGTLAGDRRIADGLAHEPAVLEIRIGWHHSVGHHRPQPDRRQHLDMAGRCHAGRRVRDVGCRILLRASQMNARRDHGLSGCPDLRRAQAFMRSGSMLPENSDPSTADITQKANHARHTHLNHSPARPGGFPSERGAGTTRRSAGKSHATVRPGSQASGRRQPAVDRAGST